MNSVFPDYEFRSKLCKIFTKTIRRLSLICAINGLSRSCKRRWYGFLTQLMVFRVNPAFHLKFKQGNLFDLNASAHIFFARTPFLKLLIPIVAGIAIQTFLNLPLSVVLVVLGIFFVLTMAMSAFPSYVKFRIGWLKALFIQIIWFCIGSVLFIIKDVRYNKNWFGHIQSSQTMLVATLAENPVEKDNSFKAEAVVRSVIDSNRSYPTTGSIIIYFKKDIAIEHFTPGSQVAFKKPLQEIKNTGNPGAFDYKRYSLFNGITHTVYLTEDDFVLLPEKNITGFKRLLFSVQQYVLAAIKKYIPGTREQGLAEALLIGYKNDLDRELLQSYTNTGVVHVIAVSGMHLALIFWILDLLFKPFLKNKKTKWLHPVLIIAILWLFTLVAGGAASIVRAAVMFTFIVLGSSFGRRASVYNTLAASAFVLLCYNPYWLWDVGFQLSYAAVLSIVIFYKPIYHLLFIKNKLLSSMWKLVAVSIAAQILTTPIAIYHFHQFPVYFIITNIFIVPVSSLVLIGELVLVLLSPINFAANILGKILSALIWWMNSFIERLEKFPLAVWDGLQVTQIQVAMLYIIIAGIGFWLIEKRKTGLWIGLVVMAAFFAARSLSFFDAQKQRKIIVYNIVKHDAIDFIDGRNYYSLTDTFLQQNNRLINLNLKPSRTLYRLQPVNNLPGLSITNNAINFFDKKILIINAPINLTFESKTDVDFVILSGNPRLYISDLVKVVVPKQLIISGSTPAWKAGYWKRDCDSLKIPCHNVAEKGAFVINLR